MSASEICFKTASELAELLGARDVSAKEVVAAHLEQIARVNPKVNAICTLAPEKALGEAERADRSDRRGPLHGLPVAIKTAHPAVSVPCGFTPGGLPIGLQIVGRYGEGFALLSMAREFERSTRVAERRPPVAL